MNLGVPQGQVDLYLLLHQLVLLCLVCPLGLADQACRVLHAAQACPLCLSARWFLLGQGGHLDPVAHLLLGPLCLPDHQGGRLVLDLPLSHESQDPLEDLEVPPSQVPLWALQVLELQQGLEVQLCQQNQEIL